jgi:hypothetical protein
MAEVLHANEYDRKSSPQSGVRSARLVPMRLASQPSWEGSESSNPPLTAILSCRMWNRRIKRAKSAHARGFQVI